MRSSHRNRALIQFAIALGMTLLLIFMFIQGKAKLLNGQLAQEWLVFWFFLYLATTFLWMVASFSLARAKGHHPDKMGCIFGFLFLAGTVIPIAPFLFPAYVIFGLEDLEKRRRW